MGGSAGIQSCELPQIACLFYVQLVITNPFKVMTKGSQKPTANRTQPDTSKRVRKSTKTVDWRPAFLKSMAKLGNVSKACKAAKIGRSTAYEMREKDAKFLKDWDESVDEATDALE